MILTVGFSQSSLILRDPGISRMPVMIRSDMDFRTCAFWPTIRYSTNPASPGPKDIGLGVTLTSGMELFAKILTFSSKGKISVGSFTFTTKKARNGSASFGSRLK